MGQFMAMGIACRISASLKDLRKEKISNKELRQGIEQDLLFDMNLYDETEEDESLLFTLKNQALESDLIPFLETFYPVVYKGGKEKEYRDLLEQLRSTPSTEWLDLANEKCYYDFQYDEYAESRYIEFSKPFRPRIRLDFEFVMLHCGYGKIMTEGLYDFTDFFKYCINETFKEHPIAKSMQVYITG